jgi:putative FmdB family regulatory protein
MIYEYRCTKCGHEFEEMRHVADPNPACPKVVQSKGKEVVCGGEVEKLISKSSFQLKGDGWAKDGYA